MNLLPEKLVYNASGALQVALGAGKYVTVKDRRTGAPKTRIVAEAGKKLTDVTSDLIPIYDTIALAVATTNGTTNMSITRPTNKFAFFDGNPQLTWIDTTLQQTVQKNDNWNNMSGTNGNAVGNNDAYAAIGIYFEIHPYISFQFENWLLKLLNPTLNIEVGQRRLKRFTTKMCHYKNYNPLKGLDSTVVAGVAGDTAPMRGLMDRDELPTQMWNTPLVLMPQDTIKIEIDFTNSLANYLGNYTLSANELLAYQGAAAMNAVPPVTTNRFLMISAGFFGLRGARVA
jgi:hypothetical protein